MQIEWSESWSVGDAQLDEEHRGLAALINGLERPVGARGEAALWQETLAELILYVEHHFRHEEARMVEWGYPGLEQHRAGHLRFRAQITRLAQEAEGTAQGLCDLHDFLAGWLKHHVLVEDRGYGPFRKALVGPSGD